MDIFTAGRDFVRRDARLLESRLFATVFEDADPQGVVDALRGYQNADGGFGHGLEPDKRCPDSLALDVEVAFDTLLAAGARDDLMIRRAVDWLGLAANQDGAVSLCAPAVEDYPHAEHISEWTYQPGLNPTAGLVGRLHKLGFEHPWREKAGAWCSAEVAKGFPEDAHGMHEVLEFLEHTDDVDLDRVRDWLPKLQWFRADAADPTYGVTPLSFAPTPDSFGARSSPRPNWTPTWTACSPTSNPTAAGPSPGNPRAPRPLWRTEASSPSAHSAPSRPTTGSNRIRRGARLGGRPIGSSDLGRSPGRRAASGR